MKETVSKDPTVIISDEISTNLIFSENSFLKEELSRCRTEKRKNELLGTRNLIINDLGIRSFQKDENGKTIRNKDGDPILKQTYSVETGTVLTINTKTKKLYNGLFILAIWFGISLFLRNK